MSDVDFILFGSQGNGSGESGSASSSSFCEDVARITICRRLLMNLL